MNWISISTIKVNSANLTYEVHLRADKLKVVFNADGTLAKVDTQPLKHLVYNVNVPPVDQCTRTDVYPDGTLVLKNGSLKIHGNIVDVVLDIDPSMQYEKLHYACPYKSPDIEVTWSMPFKFAMIDTLQGDTMVVKDWNYVGDELFSEAIFEGTKPFGEGDVYNSTFLDLVHVPGQ